MSPRRMNTRQMVKEFYRAWWKRPFWLLAALVVPVIVGRIMLTPLVKGAVRHRLEAVRDRGQVTFGDLDIFLFPPSFNFQDVKVRGVGGDALDVERVEVHVAHLNELVDGTPGVRLRLVRPQARLHPGAGDLERLARALPASRIEVTTVENGTLASTASPEERPMFTSLTGDIEGLGTGGEVGKRPWKLWLDGRWAAANPLHALVESRVDGSWKATLTGRQLASATAGAAGPDSSLAVEARLQGLNERANGSAQMTWSGESPPVALAEETLRTLSGKWPAADLSSRDVRWEQLPGGHSVHVDLARDQAPNAAPGGSFRPFDCVGMFVQAVVRANEAVLLPMPPPAGVATLSGTEPVDTAVGNP